MQSHPSGPSLLARRLGAAGLVPFIGAAAALWSEWPREWPPASMVLLGYGATICSFLGAIHWGLVMRDGHAHVDRSLIWGVLPSLLGWVALLLGDVVGLLLMATLLWVCFAMDRILYPQHQLQGWLQLRLRLTVVASVACLVGALALLR